MTALVTRENDLAIVNNRLVLSENNSDQEIQQRLMQNLQMFLGEWFLDITLGIPYLQLIFVKGVSPLIVSSSFREAILATDGIVGLERFDPVDYNPATRQIMINFVVRTVNNSLIPVGFTP